MLNNLMVNMPKAIEKIVRDLSENTSQKIVNLLTKIQHLFQTRLSLVVLFVCFLRTVCYLLFLHAIIFEIASLDKLKLPGKVDFRSVWSNTDPISFRVYSFLVYIYLKNSIPVWLTRLT